MTKKVMSKTIVYIDGENTFFQLFDSLRRKKLARYREDLVKFDLVGLLEEVLGKIDNIEYRYYGARLKEIDTSEELLKRTQKMIDHKRRWSGFLSNQGVNFISAGNLKIRNKNPSGEEADLTFVEKGIDVKMATDLVVDAFSNDVNTAVIWSSDSDIQPAMLAASKVGVHITYLCHEERINDVLAGTASETKTINIDQIAEAFKRANS